MKSDWHETTLGACVHFQNGKKRPVEGGAIPVYGGNGVLNHTNRSNDRNCVIIGRVGAYCGSVFREKGVCWVSDNAISATVKNDVDIDIDYMYYFLKNAELNRRHIGTSQPLLTQEILNSIFIHLPPLLTQKKIAAILSALDEKIATNLAINDNLEQQMFLLYKNITMASSYANGTSLSNLCAFQEGYVNPAQTHPEYFDGDVKWLRAVDINESFITETSRTLTKAGFESAKKSALLFKPNTIAISKSGTIGRLGIIADYMCGNRAVINIAPNDESMLAFIYCFLKNKQKEFPDMAVGSVQKNLYVSLLEPLTVFMPDDELLTAFNATGASLLSAIHNNCIENTKLANLRDTLLPKLISGEIDVSAVQL